jgi:hypothetical protein
MRSSYSEKRVLRTERVVIVEHAEKENPRSTYATGFCQTRVSSPRQLPTDHDYAVSTREYQSDQPSQKLLDRRLALSSLTRRERKTSQTFPFFSPVSENGPRAQGFAYAAQPQRALDRSGPFSEIFWLRGERLKVENQKQHQQQTKRCAIKLSTGHFISG